MQAAQACEHETERRVLSESARKMETKYTGAAKEGQRESARETRRQGEGGEKYFFFS